MDEQRWLVVGLGNPGPRYAATRHNAGALVVQLLAERSGGPSRRFGRRSAGGFKSHPATRCEIVEARLSGVPVVLAKPMSYMNESGGPVASAARYFKVPVERIAVVHDELDLPFGALRLKRGGGEGGHNGLRSASASLGSVEYARVRFGIGRPPGRQEPVDYVLREFSGAERKELPFLLDRAGDAVEALVSRGLEAAQNDFND